MSKRSTVVVAAIMLIGTLGCSKSNDNTPRDSTSPGSMIESAKIASVQLAGSARQTVRRTAGGVIPGQYIVRLRLLGGPGESGRGARQGGTGAEKTAEKAAVATALQVTNTARSVATTAGIAGVTRVFTTAVQGFVVSGVDSAHALALAADPRVERITPDRVASIATLSRGDGPFVRQTGAPWGLDRIDAAGTDSNYDYSLSGDGVDVYVFDTGINTAHVDFEGRATVWWDTLPGGHQGQDCHGHGTHVSGIIGGAKFGVAKKVRLHAARVIDCDGSGEWSVIIAGIDRLARQQRATPNRRTVIANLSIAGDAPIQDVDDAIAGAASVGIVFIVAAGNDDDDACKQTSAHSPIPPRVGASNAADERADFSNKGACVDLFAPGKDIPSAWWTSPTAEMVDEGTSMAAPHVSGVVAQLLETDPRMRSDSVRMLVLRATGLPIHGASSAGTHLVHTMPWH